MSGWIKLLRQLKDWEWYKDLPTCKLFLHLLISANHKPSRWQGVEILTGQIVVGRKVLSHETGLSEQQIRTALDKLKATNSITIKSTNKYSIISITKWNEYQSDQPTDTPTDNQQSTTNKNDKNVKKKEDISPIPPKGKSKKPKSDYSEIFLEAWPIYPSLRKGEKADAWKAWQAAIKRGHTEQQILEGVKKYAASDEASGSYAKGYPAWLNGNRFTWEYKPMGAQGGHSSRGNRGFDALATAAAKISQGVDREAERLRRENPVLYYQRLANQSGGGNDIAGSLEAPDAGKPDAAPLGIGHSQEG